MVTIIVCCSHCGSENLKRNGHSPNGKQKYYCKDCKKQSRENPTPYAYPKERREEILRSYEERSSLRGLTRTFGVARNTVSVWLKKKQPNETPPRVPGSSALLMKNTASLLKGQNFHPLFMPLGRLHATLTAS